MKDKLAVISSTNNESRIRPHMMIPTNILQSKDNKYIGCVEGYYVPNTNYYNIVPQDIPTAKDRVHTIERIFSKNIFELIPFCNIDYIEVKIDNTLTPSQRFNASLKKSQCNTSISIEKQTMDCIRNILKADPIYNEEADENWWNEFFDTFLSGTSLELVVGYWENEELHFVQVATRKEVKVEAYSLQLDVFSRNTGILESSIMLNKSAMFIGCGSVGSLVALELAKAGVGRFLLIDNDVFGYHNICRHQCGIYDVGKYKTDALAERILQINPYAEIVKRNLVIEEVDRDEIKEFCDHNSIVIGGADNREGDLYASKLAIEIGMPFMSIGCWERAFAGEIFYSLPSGQPTYADFLDAVGYVSGRVTQNRRFYTTEEDLEKVSFEPGISADVNFVTIIAVKIALDLLNRDNEEYTQRLLPHITQYTLVCNTNNPKIGGEQAEIFSYPLQVTTSIVVPYSKRKE